MLQCFTQYGNGVRADREVVSEEGTASYAIVDLVRHLDRTANAYYRNEIITWFLEKRGDYHITQNGTTTDIWVWSD